MRNATCIPLLAAAALAAACGDKLEEADELLAMGDFEGAEIIYQERLDKKPADAAGTIGLARTHYLHALEDKKNGSDTVAQWEEVVETMEKAVVIDPAPEGVQPVTQEMMADTLFRAGMKRFEAEKWQGAAEYLEEAEQKGRENAELYAAWARAEANAGNVEDALAAAQQAVKADPRNVELMRAAAGWAAEAQAPWLHHRFFRMAEEQEPSGFDHLPPARITGGLARKYKALNMMNDVLGTFLFEEELGRREWKGLTEREALLEDMEKFLARRPPRDFAAADRGRLGWVVYHYWNTAGVVFTYMGDTDRARKWFERAAEVARSGDVSHPEVSADELEKQLSWAEENAQRLP